MTRIALKDGRVVFRDGKVVADEACCNVNCCGGVARSPDEAGDCCANIWHAAPEGESSPDRTSPSFVPFVWQSAECPAGTVYARWGEFGMCCGCVPSEIFDPRVGQVVPTANVIDELCCEPCLVPYQYYLPYDESGSFVGCFGRCCADDDCSRLRAQDCAAEVHPTHPGAQKYAWSWIACCGVDACNIECCDGSNPFERATFAVGGPGCPGSEWMLTVGEASYVYTATPADKTTDDVAIGLADLVGNPFSAIAQDSTVIVTGINAGDGRITQPGGVPQPPVSIVAAKIPPSQCFGQGGVEPTNGECPCQPDEVCCERATSNGVSLTFTKPATFSGSVRVTVTGTVGSPILIHGVPVAAGEINHSFTLCYGTFSIEPTTCGATLNNLNVKVCYEQEVVTAESFNFSGCNGLTFNLGSCPDCVTTMVYAGAGHTSDSTIIPTGNFVIEANGSGALVLTNNITLPSGVSCPNKIRLSGTSTADNRITGQISGIGVGLDKEGTGTWVFARNYDFTANFRVLDGTAIFTAPVPSSGQTPVGSGNVFVGGNAVTGEARLLIKDILFNRTINVQSGNGQRVLIGTAPGAGPFLPPLQNSFGTAPLSLNREVTLVAASGSYVTFSGAWTARGNNVRIGAPGFDGRVRLVGSAKTTTGTVSVEYGTLFVSGTGGLTAGLIRIDGATLDWAATAALASPLGFTGTNGLLTGTGTVRFTSTVEVAGTGHHVSSNVAVTGNTTISGNGDLLISGVVSGGSTLTHDGTGTVSLSGNNTYTGTTTINSGTMKAESLTAFGTGGIVVNAGGTLDKNGFALANTITNNGGTVLN